MQDEHVILCPLHPLRIQNIEIFQTDIIFLVKETFSLDPGHIEDIQTGHNVVQTDIFLIPDPLFLQLFCNVIGHPKLRRGDKDEADPFITGQGVDQGMDRAAEFQVAAEADGKIAQPSFQRTDGMQVGQGLGRVLMSAVAAVDDRNG